jgi:hypothetical protein
MVSIAASAAKAHCYGYRNGIAMRHILTSFLTLHWAVIFALLAFACVDGGHGVIVMFGMLGATVPAQLVGTLEKIMVAAPLAVAFMIVSLLFCWAFIEVFVGDEGRSAGADRIIRVAFIAAASVLLLVLAGGATQGIDGLFLVVAAHMTAIMTSYLAMLGERWSFLAVGQTAESEGYSTARVMAQAAAHNSTLVRFSGRTRANPGRAS